MLNHLLAFIATILLVLCMLTPFKKKHSRLQWLNHHVFYAIALIVVALIHGIIAGSHPTMLSGKMAWIALVLLVILAIPHQRFKCHSFRKIHRSLAILTCGLILIHIVYTLSL